MLPLAHGTYRAAILDAKLFIFAMHCGQRHHQQQQHDKELHAGI